MDHRCFGVAVARSLAKEGIATLRFDFTGLGGSEGDFGRAGFATDFSDLVDSARHLIERFSGPLLLVGHSLGGAAVLAAADDLGFDNIIPMIPFCRTLDEADKVLEIMAENGQEFRYPSYVQDILGPMCFDYGFGPFRWVCTSGDPVDLQKTDDIALQTLEEIKINTPCEIQQQIQDNIKWIREAFSNKLVVGSQARILYADAEGRAKIAMAFNAAINSGEISAPIVLGRDHHDVGGTDSPFRETSNIYDGSKFTADMAIHNVIGDSFRGATWVSIHNGGGVGWGEVINGGFGLVLDGSEDAVSRLKNMLFYDVNNGISRRGWARNKEALFAIKREMARTPELKVTLPNIVEDELLDLLFP